MGSLISIIKLIILVYLLFFVYKHDAESNPEYGKLEKKEINFYRNCGYHFDNPKFACFKCGLEPLNEYKHC